MINHIVLLAVKDGASATQINEMFYELEMLNGTIPQIQSFTWGVNNSPEGLHRGYNYGFTMQFSDSADRDYYLAHPDHIRIAQEVVLPLLKDGVDSALAFDYEVSERKVT